MPIQLGNGAVRYSREEANEMYDRGEIRPHDSEGTAERIAALSVPAGVRGGHRIRVTKPKELHLGVAA